VACTIIFARPQSARSAGMPVCREGEPHECSCFGRVRSARYESRYRIVRHSVPAAAHIRSVLYRRLKGANWNTALVVDNNGGDERLREVRPKGRSGAGFTMRWVLGAD